MTHNMIPPRRLPPPGGREVPGSVAFVLRFASGMALGGWAFFLFGSMFGWAFGYSADIFSPWMFNRPLATAHGEVLACETSGYSEGDEDNSEPVYRYDFRFGTPDERYFEGRSYKAGLFLQPGSSVTVEYAPDDPAICRIKGHRMRPLGWVGIFVLVFPGFALLIVWGAIAQGGKNVQLLRHGVIADAVFEGSREDKDSDGDKITKYRFRYVDRNGAGHVLELTGKPSSTWREGSPIVVVFSDAAPDKAQALSKLWGVRLGPGDTLQPPGPLEIGARLLLPLIAIVVNIGVGWWMIAG